MKWMKKRDTILHQNDDTPKHKVFRRMQCPYLVEAGLAYDVCSKEGLDRSLTLISGTVFALLNSLWLDVRKRVSVQGFRHHYGTALKYLGKDDQSIVDGKLTIAEGQ